jgi:hypothetical protein
MRKELFIFILFVVLCMNGCRWTLGEKKCESDEDCPYDMYCGSEKVCVGGISDFCTPNCKDRQCGDDGCGGICGSCGDNALCNLGKCACKSGFGNCNDNWDDGCEKQEDPKHLWSKSFGGISDDYGYSVSVDSSGNVYITGYFWSSAIDFGGGALKNAGNWDIFLAKFDSNGNHKWSKRFGGSNYDYGYSVSVDSSGNVCITGHFYSSAIDFGGGSLTNANNNGTSDIFLAKFDSNGNHKWSKRFGGG